MSSAAKLCSGAEPTLFDPRPKRRRGDLYNFDEELRALQAALGQPLVVVTGLRRTGKTSLMLTALEESGRPYVYVDLRAAVASWRELYRALSAGLSDLLRSSRLGALREAARRALGLVRGVSVGGVSVELSWGRSRPTMVELLSALDHAADDAGASVVLVVDEAQMARGTVGSALQAALAYAYDHLRRLSIVVSGSEMGVLYGLLRGPVAPLYGRAYVEVRTRRLTREESVDFLERGFSELGVRVPRGEVEEAAERLDGIVGWLAYYGYSRAVGGRGLAEIWEDAVGMARAELESFLSTRAGAARYRLVLRLLASGVRDWRGLMEGLERAEGRPVSRRALHDILSALRAHSIIGGENEFLDPLVAEAARRL